MDYLSLSHKGCLKCDIFLVRWKLNSLASWQNFFLPLLPMFLSLSSKLPSVVLPPSFSNVLRNSWLNLGMHKKGLTFSQKNEAQMLQVTVCYAYLRLQLLCGKKYVKCGAPHMWLVTFILSQTKKNLVGLENKALVPKLIQEFFIL